MPTYCLLPLAYFRRPTEDRMPTRLTSFPRLVLRKLSYRVYENIPILRLYKAPDRSNLLFVCFTAGTCAKCMRVFSVRRYSVWFTINNSRERRRWEITGFFLTSIHYTIRVTKCKIFILQYSYIPVTDSDYVSGRNMRYFNIWARFRGARTYVLWLTLHINWMGFVRLGGLGCTELSGRWDDIR